MNFLVQIPQPFIATKVTFNRRKKIHVSRWKDLIAVVKSPKKNV